MSTDDFDRYKSYYISLIRTGSWIRIPILFTALRTIKKKLKYLFDRYWFYVHFLSTINFCRHLINMSHKEERRVSKTLKTLGGMAGGAVEACALQPLDTGE